MPDCGVVLQSAPTIRRLTRFPCKLFLCLAGFFAGETRETKLVRSSFFFFLLFFFSTLLEETNRPLETEEGCISRGEKEK